jgi:hypothetical protein
MIPLPNYCTPGEVRSWLRRHPHFVARSVFKNEEPPESRPNTEVESSAPEADLAAIRHHAQWAADRKSAEFLRALCDELERRRASSVGLGGAR